MLQKSHYTIVFKNWSIAVKYGTVLTYWLWWYCVNLTFGYKDIIFIDIYRKRLSLGCNIESHELLRFQHIWGPKILLVFSPPWRVCCQNIDSTCYCVIRDMGCIRHRMNIVFYHNILQKIYEYVKCILFYVIWYEIFPLCHTCPKCCLETIIFMAELRSILFIIEAFDAIWRHIWVVCFSAKPLHEPIMKLLSFGLLGTNFRDISIEIQDCHLKNCTWKCRLPILFRSQYFYYFFYGAYFL